MLLAGITVRRFQKMALANNNAQGLWRICLALAFLSFCAIAADSQYAASDAPPAHTIATKDWPSFVDRFLEDYFVAEPSFAVDAGRHEFDGQLPDWRPSAR
jgi:hypothetical protein